MLALDLSPTLNVLMVVVGIGLLILIHELGHYLCARWAGVRVEAFSIGFGPRLWGVQWGDTDYRLSAIPFGGYVKVAGETPDEAHGDSDDLMSKSLARRAFFFSGGVLMNLMFALIAFPIVFWIGVPFTSTQVHVPVGSPAWEAGIVDGEHIRAVDGKPMYSFENMVVELALANSSGANLVVEGRDGGTRAVRVVPEYLPDQGFQTIGVDAALEDRLEVGITDPEGAAAKAGFRDGDELLSVDGQQTRGHAGLRAFAQVLREPALRPIQVIAERDGQRVEAVLQPVLAQQPALLGVEAFANTVRGLRGALRNDADPSRLLRGDEVVSVGGMPIHDQESLQAAIGGFAVEQPVQFVVRRQGHARPLELSPVPAGAARENLFLSTPLAGADNRVFPKPGMAAAEQGLRAGDRIVQIEGQRIDAFADLFAFMRSSGKDGPLTLQVQRTDGRIEMVQVTPRSEAVLDLGFVPSARPISEIYQVTDPLGAVGAGFVCSIDLIKQMVVTLKKIVTGGVSATNLGGPITIARATYHYSKSGWVKLLYFLALISINLAFINVLPIPILDGGHLLFLLIERVKGSPVSERVFSYSQLVGMVFIVLLMLYVTFHDLRRWLVG